MPRNVTEQPIGIPARSLKFEIDMRARLITGRWPAIVVSSANSANLLKGELDVEQNKIFVVQDGVDVNEFRMYKVGDKTANFITNDAEYGGVGTSAIELTNNVTYLEADLFNLQFAQSADVLYISHDSYPPRKLLRLMILPRP